MVSDQKIYVSGYGALSGFGGDVRSLWDGILGEASLAREIPNDWALYSESQSNVYVPFRPDFEVISPGFSSVEKLQHDECALAAMAATYEALDHAGLKLVEKDRKSKRLTVVDVDPARLSVILGTGVAGITTLINNAHHYHLNSFSERLRELGNPAVLDITDLYYPKKFTPLNKFAVPRMMPNSLADSVAIKFGAHGHVDTVCHACASGTTAIGRAYRLIRSGLADIVIAGGSEYLALHSGALHKGFDIAGTLVRPKNGQFFGAFDRDRSGFLYSEGGAGIVILESAEHIKKRGGNPLAVVHAYAENFECHSLMMMEPSGKKIKLIHHDLLEESGLSPGDIDYINAHGTGTQANDKIESAILFDIFGDKPFVNSSKSILGHTIGASGALEFILTLLQIRHGIVHSNVNLKNPIAPLRLNKKNEISNLGYAISTSFAFGGHNAGLLLGKPA